MLLSVKRTSAIMTTEMSTETVYIMLYFYGAYLYYLIFIFSFNNNQRINVAFTTALAKTHGLAVYTLMLPESSPSK